MANRLPGHQGIRPMSESQFPMGIPSAMMTPNFHPRMGGTWTTQQPQRPSGFAPVNRMVSPQQQQHGVPQQLLQQPAKDRNYLQQQQKLRAMASSFKKPTGALSADSLIEDLLQKKETFSMNQPVQNQAFARPNLDVKSPSGNTEGKSGFIGPNTTTSPSTQFPLWLSAEAVDLLPAVYKRVWELTKITSPDGREFVDTNKIFSILLTSGLPRDSLGYIWNLANTGMPGVLTRGELNVALALVGLAQSGWNNFTNVSILSMTPQPPVPVIHFEAFNNPVQNITSPIQSQPIIGGSTSPMSAQHSMISPQFNQSPQSSSNQSQAIISTISSNQQHAMISSLSNQPPLIPSSATSPMTPNPNLSTGMSSNQILSPLNLAVTSTLPLEKSSNLPEFPPPLKDSKITTIDDDFTDFQSAPLSKPSEPSNTSPSFFSPCDSPLGFNAFASPPASPAAIKPKGSRDIGSRLANYSFGAPRKSESDESTDFKLEDTFAKINIKPPPQQQEQKKDAFTSSSATLMFVRDSMRLSSDKAKSNKTAEEDKYSALRDLAFNDNDTEVTNSNAFSNNNSLSTEDDFGDFLSGPSLENDSFAELSKREKPINLALPTPIINQINAKNPVPVTEEWSANFEDFTTASATTTSNNNATLATDWLDSANNFVLSPSITTTMEPYKSWGDTATPSSSITTPVIDDDDFGDFVGPSTANNTSISLPTTTTTITTSNSNNRLKDPLTKTPDSQSVASLELGGFDNLSLGGGGQNSSPEGGTASTSDVKPTLEGIQWDTATNSAAAQEGQEWKQCLQGCLALLQAAARILGAIDDPNVADEVVSSKEGEDYLLNLFEVYCVTQRISAASHQLLPSSRKTLEPLLAEVEAAWSILSPFLERSSIEVRSNRKWNVSNDNSSTCALCLVLVEDSTDGNSGIIKSGQHSYHASCANLWVNCVNSSLPTIFVP